MATFKWKGASYIVTKMWPEGGLFGNLDKVVQAFLEAAVASVNAPTFEEFLIAVEYEMAFRGYVFQQADSKRVFPVEHWTRCVEEGESTSIPQPLLHALSVATHIATAIPPIPNEVLQSYRL